ncbi:arabinan endo-1,5-alpha-L-arabinosidase [Virgibacillus natechei]|uniref:Endo-alpha-(1->5)-L-arabinanase n=1 Tax=Virgibacillus natechei TaxID=1216297 RepID=A0ABS4IEB4_9BACI|nr:arabinan endo-1,5-alpha-L-arabinosidase [Virgibacillus natechei]MBP1969289.1 arabinan endo-1,5-alpha-L-arabinosidase [Virgibacillus natechei]UZD12444.1 arabinan endo-1,5-alpha-L-arabinosidase [Virgibacillus natechei]
MIAKVKFMKRGVWSIVTVMIVGFLLFSNYQERGEAKVKEPSNNAPPEGTVPMTGEIGDYVEGEIDDPVHDPSIFKDGNTYYVVSTGMARDTSNPGGIYLRKSTETIGGSWEAIGEIPVPEWVEDYNIEHLWAPHVVKKGNTFYLYYSASIFGTNNSAIGVAKSNKPGDIDSWEDLGPVLTSKPGEADYNAIDPTVFKDKGKWWMVFGSHFSGIQLQELENMTEPIGPVYTIASREKTTEHNTIEAPTIFKKGKYYYLVTSWDQCCAGLDSTYKVAIGRSENVTGPYVDKDGVPLTKGGGEVVLSSHSNQIGPGGQDILKDRGKYYMVHHYYDRDANGVIRMQIRSMYWEDGWPYFF